MKILVINGSPKGNDSVTLQTVNYLKIKFPEQEFLVLNAAQQIKKLQKDFAPVLEMVKKADVLLFCYPVYTFIAPCQLHSFISLLKNSGADIAGKFASQISTSKHFYDVTAHRYIQDNCADMGLKYIKGLSADMDDILTAKGRKQAVDFFNYIIWSVQNNSFEMPSEVKEVALYSASLTEAEQSTKEGDIVIVTDCAPEDTVLMSMINRFRAVSKRNTRVVNIADYPFSGGCLGCFNCAVSGKCIYKDGFDDFLRNNIQTAEATVYAFSIKDHSMGVTFKTYDDRQFCNGHRTVTMGAPVGYLISGNYKDEYNLQMIVNGRAEVGGNFLAGVASNTSRPDEQIDKLAASLEYAIINKYQPPQNFYGVGGMKIFRDLIWLMQGMMRADHKFYKAHGQYDFPQKQRGKMLAMYAVGTLMSNKKLKKKMGNKMTEGMLMPYNKMLEKAENGKA